MKGHLYKEKAIKIRKGAKTIRSAPRGFCLTWDVDDNQPYKSSDSCGLGLGDFVAFNFMLLLLLNRSLSMLTNIYIAIGHIISMQIGHALTSRLGRLYKLYGPPGLPLPVIIYSMYNILLDAFFLY